MEQLFILFDGIKKMTPELIAHFIFTPLFLHNLPVS